MEDLINKLHQRIDAMNLEVKDSFREIVDALKSRDTKIDFVRKKTEVLESAVHSLQADIAEEKAAFHMAPASPTSLLHQGDGLLPRPPASSAPSLALTFMPLDSVLDRPDSPSKNDQWHGWVPNWDCRTEAWSSLCEQMLRIPSSSSTGMATSSTLTTYAKARHSVTSTAPRVAAISEVPTRCSTPGLDTNSGHIQVMALSPPSRDAFQAIPAPWPPPVHVCIKTKERMPRPVPWPSFIDDIACLQLQILWPQLKMVCNILLVVTDGSRILGLGDLGVQGIGIAIGKLDLYVAAAGINPQRVLPVMIDVGINNEQLLKAPLYLGLQAHRLEGEEYVEIIAELMQAVFSRWPNVIVQFEDFQAGLLGAVRAQGRPMIDFPKQKIVVTGAGSAGIGVVNAASRTMASMLGNNEVAFESARSQFWIVDAHGLITEERADQGNNMYPFPGIGLGTLLSGARIVSDGMLQAAAERLASHLKEEEVLQGIIYPPTSRIRDITKEVAAAVVREIATWLMQVDQYLVKTYVDNIGALWTLFIWHWKVLLHIISSDVSVSLL